MIASVLMTIWLLLVVSLASLGISFLTGWASIARIADGIAWPFKPKESEIEQAGQ